MTTEDKFIIALDIISVVLFVFGWIFSNRLASAPPRVIRTVWPVTAVLTAALFASFVFIARSIVKG